MRSFVLTFLLALCLLPTAAGAETPQAEQSLGFVQIDCQTNPARLAALEAAYADTLSKTAPLRRKREAAKAPLSRGEEDELLKIDLLLNDLDLQLILGRHGQTLCQRAEEDLRQEQKAAPPPGAVVLPGSTHNFKYNCG